LNRLIVKSPRESSARSSLPAVISDMRGQMILVPALDPISPGDPEHASSQKIVVPDFYIDEAEVSNAEYRRFCRATGHLPPPIPDFEEHPNDPVSGVSYDDALSYATWAGVRLPTEQEWEKAARGTDGRRFPWGNSAWTDNIPDRVQPVISEPSHRSPYGVYNMAGNVWEWTTTPYAPTESEIASMKQFLRGRGLTSDWRVTKGGSFHPGESEYFEIAKHRGLPVDAKSPWVGFRCVRSATPSR
jgi:formylglycine-generating enzyme required for sulfatase activity